MSVAPVGTLTSVKVAVSITHSFRGDLQVTLVHPSGTSVILYNGPRGDATANLNVSFPDQMAPVQALTVLNGKAVNGSWRLNVKDLAAGDVGSLVSWSLTLGYNQTVSGSAVSVAGTGAYTITGLPAGTYTVRPTMAGRTFTPASTVVVVGPSKTGINFRSTTAFAGHPAVRSRKLAASPRPHLTTLARRPLLRVASGAG
jgi:subtilisin-like proprotein convertase family protein